MDFSGSEQSDFEDVFQIKELERDDEKVNETKENAVQREVYDMEDNIAPIQLKGIRDYDSSWLKNLLSELFGESKSLEELAKLESQLLDLLALESLNQRDCEKKLLSLLGHKNYS